MRCHEYFLLFIKKMGRFFFFKISGIINFRADFRAGLDGRKQFLVISLIKGCVFMKFHRFLEKNWTGDQKSSSYTGGCNNYLKVHFFAGNDRANFYGIPSNRKLLNFRIPSNRKLPKRSFLLNGIPCI